MSSTAKPKPKPPSGPALLMIDSPTTRDRDDALRVDRTDDGWRVTVHVAAVADHVELGSAADDRGRRVGWSHYGARGVTPMLGDDLEQAATLKHGEPRGSLAITLDLDADGAVVRTELARGLMDNAIATTYAAAAARLSSASQDPVARMLRDAHELAGLLLARRRANGALAIYDLSKGFAVTEDGSLVKLGDAEAHPSYIIVQEAMIAANAAVAEWAIRHEVPILFRNHQASPFAPSAKEIVEDFEVLAHSDDPARDFRTLSARMGLLMKRATYGATLRGHYGLNLPAYTHATSPLRRYADLASQRNILAHLDEASIPHSMAELDEIALGLKAADDVRRANVSERAKAVDERRTVRAVEQAGGDLRGLSLDRWLKTLKIALRGDLSPAIDAEVRRRLADGELEHSSIALILAAPDATWRQLGEDALRWVEAAHLPAAMTLLSEHRQQHPQLSVEIESAMTGPSHAPTFEASIVVDGHSLPTEHGLTRKAAQQRGALATLRHVHGFEHLPAETTPRTPVPGPPSPRLAPEGNSIGWLNEHAQKHRLGAPTFAASVSGPSHLPEHVVTATYAGAPGFTARASASSKAAARALAAEQLREHVVATTR